MRRSWLIPLVLVAVALLGNRPGYAEEPAVPREPLLGYLRRASERLDCVFTVEGLTPPLRYVSNQPLIDRVEAESFPDSVEALIAEFPGRLPGSRLVRNTHRPEVLHLIVGDAGGSGPLDRTVTLGRYEGGRGLLPDHLRKAFGVAVRAATGGGMPISWPSDLFTAVTLERAAPATVREILTAAAATDGRSFLLWQAYPVDGGDARVEVYYPGPLPTEAESILAEHGFRGYMGIMAKRLDIYLTVEDDLAPDAAGKELPRILDDEYRALDHDMDVASVEVFVDNLGRGLNGLPPKGEDPAPVPAERQKIAVRQSGRDPKIIHLIRSSLLAEGYVLDKPVDFSYEGPLSSLPYKLGEAAGGLWWSGGTGGEGRVAVACRSTPVREILTRSAGLRTDSRLLWSVERGMVEGQIDITVRFGQPSELPGPK